MADTVVRTFDLYNTTFYWNGYVFPGYEDEQQVARVNYQTQFSSNPIGSQIDFFNEIAGVSQNNPVFSLTVNLDSLSYLWSRYWWDEAMYYSHPIVYDTITPNSPVYRTFSESVGSLYYVNEGTVYNPIINNLIVSDVAADISSFYTQANMLFEDNIAYIGPGTGTDVSPGSGTNGNLLAANADFNRRLNNKDSIVSNINKLYPQLASYLPFNTNVIGNLLTPFYWSLSASVENSNIQVDFTNNNVNSLIELTTHTLIAEDEEI